MPVYRRCRWRHHCLPLLLLAMTAGPSAHAGDMIQSGTGFFVSQSGYILTNEHVVRGCRTVSIRGAVEHSEVKVVNTNPRYDIALLKSPARPRQSVNITNTNSTLRVNDRVLVIGYPEERGISGIYKVAESRILALRGPAKEERWIQFANAALHGNSGGPLFDIHGNVVGIVTAKTSRMVKDPKSGNMRQIYSSDIALSLPVIKAYLRQRKLQIPMRDLWANRSVQRVEALARETIVNIHCRV